MANDIDVGFGTTVAFTGDPWNAAYVTRVDIGENTREAIDSSSMSTSGFRTFIAGDIQDPGEATVDFLWDESETTYPAISDTAGTLLITLPGTAAITGTAFPISVKWPEATMDGMMEGSVTFKWDGNTGPTYTADT